MIARPTLVARALRVLLWLMFAHAAIPAVALGETYQGLLVPDTRDAPIPITVDLQQSSGRLSGRVTTLAPLSADGRIVSGKRQRSMCDFESDMGFGQRFTFEGYCLSTMIEGTYVVTLSSGSKRRGTYRLMRTAEEKPPASEAPIETIGRPARSAAACLAANAACLGVCPRGDYNAEFLCANRCRHRLTACKGNASEAVGNAPGP